MCTSWGINKQNDAINVHNEKTDGKHGLLFGALQIPKMDGTLCRHHEILDNIQDLGTMQNKEMTVVRNDPVFSIMKGIAMLSVVIGHVGVAEIFVNQYDLATFFFVSELTFSK